MYMCYISNPKPPHLRIEKSQWYGQTIFTDKPIKEGKIIAMTVIENYDKHEGYFITPFGNLFNSTDNYKFVNVKAVIKEGAVQIISTRDISPGEEILLAYL